MMKRLSESTWLGRACREPLVHFLLFGALIFAADDLVQRTRGSPQDIVVTRAAYQEAHDTFVAGMKREPTDAELKTLTDRWVENEVLYREGLALGLDKGDPAMRDRVIFKALSLAQAGLVLPKIDEAGLQAWFAAHRTRYDAPPRFDFEEAVVDGGTAPAPKLAAFADALNHGQAPDAQGSLRVFTGRPRANLEQSYGAQFADALGGQPIGAWQILRSKDGPRIVRLLASTPGRGVDFNDVREQVYRDWKEATATALTKNAIRDIARKYHIRDEGSV